MSANGGPIQAITIDGRTFDVAEDAATKTDPGGFKNEVMVSGAGTARAKKSRKPWRISGAKLVVDLGAGDLQFLQARANGHDEMPITITYVDGTVMQGSGFVSGDLEHDSSDSTVEVELSGGGELALA